jgi:glycosyltransferase involved in cell wall biosynthesis
VFHAHQALSPALAAVLAKRLRPKSRVVVKIACSGDWSDFRLAQKRPFYRRRLALLRAVDRFIVLNRESVAELESVGLGHVPAHLIPNGVDVRRFTPPGARERQIARASLGLSSDEPVVLYVGRLERRKGIDLLLAAWAELMSKGSVPRLLIAGAGETAQWIHDAQKLGVEKHVTFLGSRGDVVPLYEAADILAFPSRAEGCPNAVLEAMACGLAVVASNVAGNLAVLGEEGRIGCLVPAEDPEALARAVSSLAASPGLCRKIGVEARRAAVERFAIDRIGAQYLSLYQELTG